MSALRDRLHFLEKRIDYWRCRAYRLERSRDMWKTRAMGRTRFHSPSTNAARQTREDVQANKGTEG